MESDFVFGFWVKSVAGNAFDPNLRSNDVLVIFDGLVAISNVFLNVRC